MTISGFGIGACSAVPYNTIHTRGGIYESLEFELSLAWLDIS